VEAAHRSVEVALLPPAALRPHERVTPARAAGLAASILQTRALRRPLIADRASLTLIDGHHRLHALSRLLGARRVPVVLVDYERDVEEIEPSTVSLSPAAARLAARLEARGDLLGVYTLIAESTPPPPGPTVAYKPPPPTPRVIVELARRGLLLPPKTTIHKTWAKSLVRPTPLDLLL